MKNILEDFEFDDVDSHVKEVYRDAALKILCRKMKIVIDMQFNSPQNLAIGIVATQVVAFDSS
jgi:hypothetical protein